MERRSFFHLALHAIWIGILGWLSVRLLRGMGITIRRQLRKIAIGRVEALRALQEGTIITIGRQLYFIAWETEEPYALLLRCTHGNCSVQRNNLTGEFVCPCHGGVFNSRGEVVQGPPTQPLPRIPLRIEKGVVYLIDQV
ncbi:MAG: ubiquinol-cytochrome c reductase iron-sulfur subunit [Bacteroidota bacterium]|nr:ubiquinol-cytochrome c reductase iron-sulfur subunit [Candidatus Kapabacteria bacterium]MCS7301980.1 ubiquinol-cytochrome c reductase iron-sulfur subunit [Candidatus Kapabacteria bacterium]MDW8074757.1 ubiquinol-cytochrome c reductase iron-sulfur subunit [Bacteroidota bacterium]MDW8271396.1 ubiquinol-cytochrome c reductase iron-sulfur subunit [Bacteroidota bacterium]